MNEVTLSKLVPGTTKKPIWTRMGASVVGFLHDGFGFSDKLFVCAFIVLLAIYLQPFFAFRYLPMQDLPAHLAVVRVWSDLGTDSVLGQTYAARDTHAPYLVVYGLLRLLSQIVSLQIAGKLVLVGYALALPLSVAYTLRSFGRDPRLSLLSFAFIFNRQFVLGFLSSMVSIPLLVFTIGLLKRYLDAPSMRREVTLAMVVIVLYFTHGLAALGFAIAGPVVFFLHVRSIKETLRRSLFVIPSLAVFAFGALRSSSPKGFVGHYSPFYTNIAELGHWAIDVLHSDVDDYALMAIVATLVICAATMPQRRIRVQRSFVMGVAGIALLIAFFFLPSHVSQPIDHWGTGGRVVIPGFLLLLGLPSIDFRGARTLLLFPALIVMLAGRVQLGRAMADFHRQAEPIDDVLAALPADKRVMCLVYEKEHPAFEASPFWHFLTYYQVQKGGATSDGLVNEGTPIQWRAAPLPSLSPHQAYSAFKYSEMGASFDYFLVLWPAKLAPQNSFPGAGNNVRLVKRNGRFAAYQNIQRP